MDLANHPCFNKEAHKRFGRVHLPVAPRCNIQCNFCNRKFDCVNESRPGVTSGVLSPGQAMVYLEAVMDRLPNTAVVGIAGPGDPFANPDETMETLRRVRTAYSDMLLCVATNGLAVMPHVAELAALKVSHVTVTVNAVDPAIGAKIYSWMRWGKRVHRSDDGARLLLANQLEAIAALKAHGVVVKINTIIIPGINDDHVATVAERMTSLNVDMMNCVPYYPNEGSNFGHMAEPDAALVRTIRTAAGRYLPQMKHCKRCRADAVGLLGEAPHRDLMDRLRACEAMPEPAASLTAPTPPPERTGVAVASLEGILVNQHLGEACQLKVYAPDSGGTVRFLEDRPAPEPGGGDARWSALADLLGDCRALLVSGIGDTPRRILSDSGLAVHVVEGLIDDAVSAVYRDQSLRHMTVRTPTRCGASCQGTGMGCG